MFKIFQKYYGKYSGNLNYRVIYYLCTYFFSYLSNCQEKLFKIAINFVSAHIGTRIKFYEQQNGNLHYDTDKKENKIFLIYKAIQMGSGAKSYMRKGFLIYERKRKFFTIYEEAVTL